MDYLKSRKDVVAFVVSTTGIFDPVRKRFRKSVMRKGTPDILACHAGHFIAIEVKTPKGRLSPEQRQCIEEIKTMGGSAIIARSLEDVVAFLSL